jgi:SAM-dependent methyltransferase
MRVGELFDGPAMAAGYATDRPPVHPHLVDRLQGSAAWPGPVPRAVDVGCGAGASTAALAGLAEMTLGVDPSVAMAAAARRTVAGSTFVVAGAEALPCAAGSVDLLAAAGALNFADLAAFARDADRVLTDCGVIVVSDYSFGRPVAGGAVDFPERFATRWPRPRAARVDAGSFASTPFRIASDDRFVVTLPMTYDGYLAYAMTDTGVADAVAGGVPADEIRSWCAVALAGFGAERPVAFDATLLVVTR